MMMESDLINQLFEMAERGDALIHELAKQGDLLAQADYSYYRQKTETAFRLKEVDGLPATMIPIVIKGMPEVAILLREREVAESRYRATQESIMMLKKQLSLIENQISREWGQNE